METILGIKGLDFVMLACDTMQAKSIIFMKDDQSKIHRLSEFSLLASIGDGGDTLQFTDYIAKHLQLYKINHGYHLSPRAAAHFTRKNLADYIRTNTRYQVSMLMAGYDEVEGPDLHYIDSFGAAQSIKHAGHGLGSLFCGSIFQRYWTEGLKQSEAYNILKMCITEVQKRLIVNLRKFDVFVVDKNGAHQLESITPSSYHSDALIISLPNTVITKDTGINI